MFYYQSWALALRFCAPRSALRSALTISGAQSAEREAQKISVGARSAMKSLRSALRSAVERTSNMGFKERRALIKQLF